MFKKLLLIIIVIGFLSPLAFAGEVTIESDKLWQEKQEREAFITARATLQNLTDVLLENLNRFDEIKQSGNFTTLPDELKQVILRWEQAYKDVKALLMADAEIVEMYQWKPAN